MLPSWFLEQHMHNFKCLAQKPHLFAIILKHTQLKKWGTISVLTEKLSLWHFSLKRGRRNFQPDIYIQKRIWHLEKLKTKFGTMPRWSYLCKLILMGNSIWIWQRWMNQRILEVFVIVLMHICSSQNLVIQFIFFIDIA